MSGAAYVGAGAYVDVSSIPMGYVLICKQAESALVEAATQINVTRLEQRRLVRTCFSAATSPHGLTFSAH